MSGESATIVALYLRSVFDGQFADYNPFKSLSQMDKCENKIKCLCKMSEQ